MKINEIILEGRDAPLYHFTAEKDLINIFRENCLKTSRNPPVIFLTRDITRTFVPHAVKIFTAISWGIRLNQSKLASHLGRKLQAGGQPERVISPKDRAKRLSNPAFADELTKFKSGTRSTITYDSVASADLIRGSSAQAARWESEEHIAVSELPNLNQYITGLVVTGNINVMSRSVEQHNKVDELADMLFKRYKSNTIARLFTILDYAIQNNIPLVFKRIDIDANEVKTAVDKLAKLRKQRFGDYDENDFR